MFEHLDDPEPFDPTNETRAAVQRRATALRQRRALVPGVSLIAIAALAIGVATGAARDSGTRVRAVAPPPATRLAITVKIQGIAMKVELNKRIYASNEIIRVTLTGENTSGATKRLSFVVCMPTGPGPRPAAKCHRQLATVTSPGTYRKTVAQRGPAAHGAYSVEIARGTHASFITIRVGKGVPCHVAAVQDARDLRAVQVPVITDDPCDRARSKP